MTDLDLDYDPDAPLDPPVAATPAEIRAEIHTEMRELVPGWSPLPTALLTHGFAAIAGASTASRAAFRRRLAAELLELSGSLHDIPRDMGQAATSSITVKALDTLGHQADAGMTVRLGDIELVTTAPLIVEVGQTEGTAPIAAVEAGAAPNGATGTPEIQSLGWLASVDPVVLDAPLAQGEDPETDPEWSARMIGELAVPRRAVRTEDLVFYARQHPSVGLAWGIPGYDLDTDTDDVALTATVVVGADDGSALSPEEIASVLAFLQSKTIENFNVYVTNPDYDPIDVTGTIVPRTGMDGDVLAAEATARVTALVSPIGHVTNRDGEGTNLTGPPPPIVHVNTLIAEATGVRGLLRVDEMEIGDGSSDFHTLSSRIALPVPGDIDITEAT
jgi:hypothetical protein